MAKAANDFRGDGAGETMLALKTWLLFTPRRQSSLRCAVWQDGPIPDFIRDETWELCGTIKAGEPVPAWFRLPRARDAMHLTGYYLFLAF